MKKYVNKLKRIVAVMLSVAMVVSLFQLDLLRTFADGEATQASDGGTITLDFVPNDVAVDSATATEKYAVINDTTIRVYKTPDYKSEGSCALTGGVPEQADGE